MWVATGEDRLESWGQGSQTLLVHRSYLASLGPVRTSARRGHHGDSRLGSERAPDSWGSSRLAEPQFLPQSGPVVPALQGWRCSLS